MKDKRGQTPTLFLAQPHTTPEITFRAMNAIYVGEVPPNNARRQHTELHTTTVSLPSW